MIRLGLLFTALLAIPLALQWTPLEILKLKTFDSLIKEQEPSGYFTILNITEEDVRAEGGYPFPRQRLAEIQQELVDKGAIGVGWVISFIDKDRFGGDPVFVNYLKSDIPTVVATFEYNNNIYPEPTGTVMLGDLPNGIPLDGYLPNIPEISAVALEGMVSAKVDADGLVRRLPLLLQTPDGWIPSFGTQVLKILAGADTFIIKGNEAGIEEIKVRGLPETKVDNLGRQWISWVDTKQTTLSEMDVADTFVFVGVTAQGVMPQLATANGELLEPHIIQAALAESMLLESPSIPYWHLSAELALLVISVFLIWLVSSFSGVWLGLGLNFAIFGSTATYGLHMINKGILIDVTYTLMAQFIAGSVAYYLNFRKQHKLRQQIKKQFEHYLDPRQVAQLQKDPSLLKLGGEKRYCTFLFTDVRGFTAMSERLDPQEVISIMNQALTIQTKAVQEHGGMVDKFIGDAMMAIFNAPLDLDKHEDKAIAAACQMRDEINKAQLDIHIGIGLCSGIAVLGNTGSESRFDYTAIGDAVNTAARLESATKDVGVDLLIGETTAQASKYELQSLEPIQVKGKTNKLRIYTL